MKVFKYTPALMDPHTLEATLIGRQNEIRTVRNLLTTAADGGSIGHPLLIGPRGIGKSHFLQIIFNAISGKTKSGGLNKLQKKFVPVILAEEEYPTSLTKFILLVVDQLRGYPPGAVPNIPPELINTKAIGPREEELALTYIREFRRQSGRFLLLLIDNLDAILQKFTVEDQGKLREILMTAESVLLIGAAPTVFDAVTHPDQPLYNFFQVMWLRDLSFAETKDLLARYAETDNRPELPAQIRKKEAKLKAIHQLAGGNPRLTLSLYHIMAEGDISSVEETFLKLLDELTPFFRERMRDLPAQQQEIVDAMAKSEQLLTPSEIAAAAQLPVTVVNSQIKRLERAGYVKRTTKHTGRGVRYDLRERLFSLWRQMRVEAGRQRLRFIVRFLELWYNADELQALLDQQFSKIAQLGTVENLAEVNDHLKALGYIKEAIPELNVDSDVVLALHRGHEEAGLAIVKTALLEKPLKFKAVAVLAYFDVLSASGVDMPETARKFSLEKNAEFWSMPGRAYAALGTAEKSVDVLNIAVELEPNEWQYWFQLGRAYEKTEDFDRAGKALKKAAKLNSKNPAIWQLLGLIHFRLGDRESAVKAYEKSAEIDGNDVTTWEVIGLLRTLLRDKGGALDALNKAVALQPERWEARQSLAFILEVFDEHEQAARAYKESIIRIKTPSPELVPLLKEIVSIGRLDLLKEAIVKIDAAQDKELVSLFKPFRDFVAFIESGDQKIIDKLRAEERDVFDEMLESFKSRPNKSSRRPKPAN